MKAISVACALMAHFSVTLAQVPYAPPSAAIHWDGLQHIRVYGVDPVGQIREWQWDSTGAWTGPSYIGAVAKIGSTVAAVNDGTHIRVYYYNLAGRYMERVYEGGWYDGSLLP